MNIIDAYVHAITHAGDDMLAYEFRPVDPDSTLPRFEAGAHIDVHITPGLIRQYSLCNNPTECHRYVICVHRDDSGRGGSSAMHDSFRVGLRARISEPRNHFPLDPADRYILVAGGIGVTPLVAMSEHLHAVGAVVELHVYARARSKIPLRDRLLSSHLATDTVTHLGDDGDTLRSRPPSSLLSYHDATLIYTCGPEGFMQKVTEYATAAGYREEQVRRERFAPSASVSVEASSNDGFDVVVASTGQRIPIPAERSIADALADNGIDVELSCEQGMCGACLTPVVAGIPDHRDDVQTDAEHAANTHITVCCSRARTAELVLDL